MLIDFDEFSLEQNRRKIKMLMNEEKKNRNKRKM